jgi:gamma-glutamyltranspeptidase/glutathione hydrolase
LCRTSALWFGVAEEVLRLTDETRKHFYKGERVYLEGEEVRFPELADTLEAVREGGVEIFYEGELARRISAYIREMGGIITEEDLAEYEAVVREPMSVRYGAGAMYTNGPPSAGGPTLAQMLKVVSAYDLANMPEAEYVRVMAGAMKLALNDRGLRSGSQGRSTRRSSGAGSSPPSARRIPHISRALIVRAWPSRLRPAWATGRD